MDVAARRTRRCSQSSIYTQWLVVQPIGGYSLRSVQGEVTQMSLITTIEDLRKLAQKRVPRMFYDYADSGSWTESTYRANESDFARIKFRQRVARNIDERSIRVTMIGQD